MTRDRLAVMTSRQERHVACTRIGAEWLFLFPLGHTVFSLTRLLYPSQAETTATVAAHDILSEILLVVSLLVPLFAFAFGGWAPRESVQAAAPRGPFGEQTEVAAVDNSGLEEALRTATERADLEANLRKVLERENEGLRQLVARGEEAVAAATRVALEAEEGAASAAAQRCKELEQRLLEYAKVKNAESSVLRASLAGAASRAAEEEERASGIAKILVETKRELELEREAAESKKEHLSMMLCEAMEQIRKLQQTSSSSELSSTNLTSSSSCESSSDRSSLSRSTSSQSLKSGASSGLHSGTSGKTVPTPREVLRKTPSSPRSPAEPECELSPETPRELPSGTDIGFISVPSICDIDCRDIDKLTQERHSSSKAQRSACTAEVVSRAARDMEAPGLRRTQSCDRHLRKRPKKRVSGAGRTTSYLERDSKDCSESKAHWLDFLASRDFWSALEVDPPSQVRSAVLGHNPSCEIPPQSPRC
eukprot:gnl/TRDRNA2_/TRDRNA2_130657_c0_seq4.p1 gnl/TRDRNA2_/TRDRNA2_130657_c0~~gnl/TRDRNA2_/TRDRNA2_130657_c0_seq4.p1  ORF type:complete len:480 (+),score=80.05 gnl/TRDRNA2_/TRDRNA2_130657_c0_seq4:81-1520(+)